MVLIAAGLMVLGLASAFFWQDAHPRGTAVENQPIQEPAPLSLSAGTLAVLRGLDSPIEIRFYSPIGQKEIPGSVTAFAERVDQLLSEYERAGQGMVRVLRQNPQLDASAKVNAKSEGIQPFPVGENEFYYLGLTVVHDRQKESISRLSPDWEAAVELDLSRAIARLINTRAPVVNFVNTSPSTVAAAEEAVRLNPRLKGVSVEQGTQILRETALAEFKAAVGELEPKLAEARQRLAIAERGGVESERLAARQQLDQIQNEQSESLKKIAARLQDQIAAFERSKGVTHAALTATKVGTPAGGGE